MHNRTFGGRYRRAFTASQIRARRFRFEPLEERLVFSGASELLLDINATVDSTPGSNPTAYVPLNGFGYFASRWGGFGGLWKTDGTPVGTTLVREFDAIEDVVNIGGVLYLSASEAGTNNRELWKSDGTAAGTALVKDIHPGLNGSLPSSLFNVNGTLYFYANDGVHGGELWKSDGTEAGTQFVADVRSGADSSLSQGLFAHNGLLYFHARSDGSTGDLWRTDGTEAGTIRLTNLSYGSVRPRDLIELNDKVLFTTIGLSGKRELWTTDGTSAGTARVVNLELTNDAPSGTLVNVNGFIYFAANDETNGSELWRTDGTAAGTQLVKDIFVGGSASPTSLLNIGGTLYFAANDGTNGVELWKSDGTAVGTLLVANIFAGGSANPANLFNAAGTLYFAANDGVSGLELWKSDGTADGTTLVADIAAGAADSIPQLVTTLAGKLILLANDGTHGVELWSSDGTAAGTFLLKDTNSGTLPLSPRRFAALGDKLLFTATSVDEGSEPWVTDGTAAGTMLLKDIASPTLDSDPQKPVNVSGTLYFVANDGVHGNELWRTDGTTAGTSLVADIRPGLVSTPISEITNVNGVAYFVAGDNNHGSELWRTDGTAAGTTLVLDIRPGGISSLPKELTNANGLLYFSADDGVHGRELWRTDGTAAGTTLALDVAAGSASSTPTELTVMNGALYYVAKMSSSSNLLMQVDLSAPDATPVNSVPESQWLEITGLAATDNRLFFYAKSASSNYSLWTFNDADGASSIWTSPYGGLFSWSAPVAAWDNSVAFVVDRPGTNDGLWRSDGTAAGTYEVAPLSPYLSSFTNPRLIFANGLLFFANRNASVKYRLWQSDGTAAGTIMVDDFALGDSFSEPLVEESSFAVVGDWLYFAATSSVSSSERNLYRTQGASTGVILVSDGFRPMPSFDDYPGSFATIGDDLFFAAPGPATGVEPRILRGAEVDKSGDYTADGVVDGADFLSWQRSFGTRVATPGAGADGSGNGVVTLNDLEVWRGRFGAQVPAPSVAFAPSSLPVEPPQPAELDAAFAVVANEPIVVGAAALALRQASQADDFARPARNADRTPIVIEPRAHRTTAQQAAPTMLHAPNWSALATSNRASRSGAACQSPAAIDATDLALAFEAFANE